jgi:hypothetical protein
LVCGLEVEHLPSMQEAPGLILSTTQRQGVRMQSLCHLLFSDWGLGLKFRESWDMPTACLFPQDSGGDYRSSLWRRAVSLVSP